MVGVASQRRGGDEHRLTRGTALARIAHVAYSRAGELKAGEVGCAELQCDSAPSNRGGVASNRPLLTAHSRRHRRLSVAGCVAGVQNDLFHLRGYLRTQAHAPLEMEGPLFVGSLACASALYKHASAALFTGHSLHISWRTLHLSQIALRTRIA